MVRFFALIYLTEKYQFSIAELLISCACISFEREPRVGKTRHPGTIAIVVLPGEGQMNCIWHILFFALREGNAEEDFFRLCSGWRLRRREGYFSYQSILLTLLMWKTRFNRLASPANFVMGSFLTTCPLLWGLMWSKETSTYKETLFSYRFATPPARKSSRK